MAASSMASRVASPFLSLSLGMTILCQKKNVVEDAINSMSLGDYANKLIGGHCYMKGLRSGERRRISIARELVMRPHILFIDEPLYHLDRCYSCTLAFFLSIYFTFTFSFLLFSLVYSGKN